MTEMQKSVWKEWAKAVAIRAARTAAEVAILVIGDGMINAFDIDWINVIGYAIGGAVLAVLFGLKGIPEAPDPFGQAEER